MSKSGMETTVIRDERGQTIGYVRDFGNIKVVEDQRGQTIGRVRDYGGDHSTLEDVKGQTTGYVDGPHHGTVLFDYFKKNKDQVVHKGLINPLTLALIASAKAVVKKVAFRGKKWVSGGSACRSRPSLSGTF